MVSQYQFRQHYKLVDIDGDCFELVSRGSLSKLSSWTFVRDYNRYGDYLLHCTVDRCMFGNTTGRSAVECPSTVQAEPKSELRRSNAQTEVLEKVDQDKEDVSRESVFALDHVVESQSKSGPVGECCIGNTVEATDSVLTVIRASDRLRSKKVTRLPRLVTKLHGINQSATIGYENVNGRELDEEPAKSGSIALENSSELPDSGNTVDSDEIQGLTDEVPEKHEYASSAGWGEMNEFIKPTPPTSGIAVEIKSSCPGEKDVLLLAIRRQSRTPVMR